MTEIQDLPETHDDLDEPNIVSEKSVASFNIRDYLRTDLFPHFLCPGCGHGIALRALLWAVHELEISKDDLAVVSGIGCSGRTGAYIDANTFHVTHGRPLAFATGLALARPDLNVIVITGDGDCLAIGGNHLIHACRRNLDITCMMLNNEVYGMTGGQASPTTSETRYTTTTPSGSIEPVFDACNLAQAAGAGFVGREVTLQTPNLKSLLKAAIAHPGFSFVEVISDCTEIFGRKNDLGESPEMILSQKAAMRPTSYGNVVDEPFRPNSMRTGILARNDRPEYGKTYRAPRPRNPRPQHIVPGEIHGPNANTFQRFGRSGITALREDFGPGDDHGKPPGFLFSEL